VPRQAALRSRRVAHVDLRTERGYLVLRLSVDRADTLIYLGIDLRAAADDPGAFDAELASIVRLVFDARGRSVYRS
jgi:hypothetical protein